MKLEKTFSKMNDDEKRLLIERVGRVGMRHRSVRIALQAVELKDKLQAKLKKSREEAEDRKKEVEQLQSKVNLDRELRKIEPSNPPTLRSLKVLC